MKNATQEKGLKQLLRIIGKGENVFYAQGEVQSTISNGGFVVRIDNKDSLPLLLQVKGPGVYDATMKQQIGGGADRLKAMLEYMSEYEDPKRLEILRDSRCGLSGKLLLEVPGEGWKSEAVKICFLDGGDGWSVPVDYEYLSILLGMYPGATITGISARDPVKMILREEVVAVLSAVNVESKCQTEEGEDEWVSSKWTRRVENPVPILPERGPEAQ